MAGAYPYSAHLGYLFTDRPFPERFRAARQHGFSAVEYPAPYGTPAAEMAAWLAEVGLPYIQFGLRSGDAARGEKGLAIFAERQAEFRASVAEGLDYAEAIGVRMVHAMAGVLPAPERTSAHWARYVDNLGFAAEAAAKRGMTILVEAMSRQAVPDYFIETPGRAAEAIAATGQGNIKLLLDVFHAVSEGLDPVAEIERHAGLIGHVHIADHPGRHEPGSGTVDFGRIATALQAADYHGFLGCEYTPAAETVAGLTWLREASANQWTSAASVDGASEGVFTSSNQRAAR